MNEGPPWLRYPQVTFTLVVLMTAMGIYSLLTMPRREDPKITIRTGVLLALYPGATSEQVEKQVTQVFEERLFQYEEVRKSKTESTSRPGFAFIRIELEERVQNPDQFWSKLRHDLIETRLLSLPPGVLGPTLDTDFGDTVALLIALHGGNYGYRELHDYSTRIEETLRTIGATSKIKRIGEQKEQIYVTATPARLSQYGVPISRVMEALQGRNIVQFGGRIGVEDTKPPIQANGLFQTPEQIGRVMVDVSRSTGQPVYIGDVARVERRYQDPQFYARYNGQQALIISVEMQEGFNIAAFGNEVRAKLTQLRPQLPSDLKIDLLADQPRMVEERISDFMREFAIAIVSVVAVTMLLLPFRVALVAAVAIPVTVSISIGVLNLLSIDLQQVSISMLVVMLGILVDDAVVIADNYVELLDRGQSREQAAILCAKELFIPVLTATVTIIAAFLPMAFLLTGNVGEFVASMPVVVGVSLTVSLLVAVFFTPLLCYHFIHQGLHSQQREGVKKKTTLVDRLQNVYDRVAAPAFDRPLLTVLTGVLWVGFGAWLFTTLPDRFFPPAEREQFVIDVWLPEGSRIEATDAVLRRIEAQLQQNPLVASYGTFAGFSAPRFYYNVDPQQPAENYGQILVNTKEVDKTPHLVFEFREQFKRTCPEAMVLVKELQQGEPFSSPIEVRIVGDDIPKLRTLGGRVQQIFTSIPGSDLVHDDWRNDPYEVKVDVREEVANRLGFSNASIARSLAMSFEGYPVSTFWEGDRAVDIVLRLDESRRRDFDDIGNAYITSPVTGARVPVRGIGTLSAIWEPGRIVRRNGVRTLTVRSEFREGTYASRILDSAEKQIRNISLPSAYRIEYGGEQESQSNMAGGLAKSAIVSALMIFLILLFQFKSFGEALIVIGSIPLAFTGAIIGLLVIRMPVSFTAEVGLIGLSGVVVRNAILLLDYINERRHLGESPHAAARDAGSRRLRPIFLTTLAAAVGVVPMILSGSLMWAPMAAVIAFGLVLAMFFTLLVVPAAYLLLMRPQEHPA